MYLFNFYVRKLKKNKSNFSNLGSDSFLNSPDTS